MLSHYKKLVRETRFELATLFSKENLFDSSGYLWKQKDNDFEELRLTTCRVLSPYSLFFTLNYAISAPWCLILIILSALTSHFSN